MSNQLDSSRSGNACATGGATPALAEASRRGVRGKMRRPLLAAGIVLAGLLLRLPPCAAQQSMGLGLKAGETYVLKGLAENGTPEGRFDDNSQCFLLECGAPG